jgi:Putative zinc-finger
MTCDRIQEMMVEALYRELDDTRAREFEEHISGCTVCAALFESLRATAAHMNEHRRPDPGDAYWNNYYQRLEERMDRERSLIDSSPIAARRRSYVSWGYRVAAAVAVLAAGVWIGRATMMRDEASTRPEVTASRGEIPADSSAKRETPAEENRMATDETGSVPDPIDGTRQRPTAPAAGDGMALASVDVRAHEYIERSQVLLLALVNSYPDTSGAGQGDFALQRERAGVLVEEAAVLRDDLPGGDNRRLRELVTDLQMILREIANLESRNDFETVEIIRNRVSREGVLMQIDVEQMRSDDVKKSQPKQSGAIDRE